MPDKILPDKAFNIAKNPKHDGYQCGHASMVYKCFDKKASGRTVKNENISNKRPLDLATRELAEELHKPIISKFKKRKVHSSFIDNIGGTDLANMQIISRCNKGFRFSLCLIDIYSNYAWVILLKDKKGITIINVFQKVFDESNRRETKSKARKPNKIWLVKGSEFFNRSLKSWLEKNDREMYSTQNEGKSVAAARFISTLKNKICKYMTSRPKILYIGKLDDIANKYNNTYHSTIEMKTVDERPSK